MPAKLLTTTFPPIGITAAIVSGLVFMRLTELFMLRTVTPSLLCVG